MRAACVRLHRWAGLATALFLAVAGLTGSLLAFKDELEAAIRPSWFAVAPPPGRAAGDVLDPFALRERVERLFPRARADHMSFARPGASQLFYLMPRADPATGRPYPLDYDQVYLDPYTGAILGARKWGELFDAGRFRPENVVPFLWRLHEALALPFPWGKWFMGAVALAWTLDCFVGLLLTWPRSAPYLRKWTTAWRVKAGASRYRLNLDLHRAGGLWLWGFLLLFAWSSVMLNLRDAVYRPAMSLAFRFADEPRRALPAPRPVPRLDFRQAHGQARQALSAMAAAQGFAILAEDSLWYRPSAGAYLYRTRTSLDLRDSGGATDLWLDGDTGRVLAFRPEGRGLSGDLASAWLRVLHTGRTGGLGYRLWVAFIGVAVAGLAVTGVIAWNMKRRARRAGAGR